jgi:hypothetical protein
VRSETGSVPSALRRLLDGADAWDRRDRGRTVAPSG